MSAPSWFMAGLLAGAAAMLGVVFLRRALRDYRGRKILLAGGIAAVAAVALIAGMSLAVVSHQETVIAQGEAAVTASQQPTMPPSGEMPPPSAAPVTSVASVTAAMPPASVMSQILAMPSAARTRSAEPMDQAAATLAARLESQGGTAADWNLLAQAYDFLGRPEDAQRARARAAQVGSVQRTR